jgi:hypothetical protein
VTVRHAYDGGTNAWADLDSSNNVLARYHLGPKESHSAARPGVTE